jgi:hypothetical protein
MNVLIGSPANVSIADRPLVFEGPRRRETSAAVGCAPAEGNLM